MKIAVLGLGESLSKFFTSNIVFNHTIGVNDITSRYKYVDSVVCVEPPTVGRTFTKARLEAVKAGKETTFYSNMKDWALYKENLKLIKLTTNFEKWDHETLPFSNNSPYIACTLAANMGATEIHIFGVDLDTHWQLSSGEMRRKALSDYSTLFEILEGKGVDVVAYSKTLRDVLRYRFE